jgi:ferrous iron transport protein A
MLNFGSHEEETLMPDPTSETQPSTLMKALGDVPAGMRGIVRELRGGQDFVCRVTALGFTLGVEVEVIQNYGRGPLIALVRDTRVALGRGEALKVLVEQIRNEQ